MSLSMAYVWMLKRWCALTFLGSLACRDQSLMREHNDGYAKVIEKMGEIEMSESEDMVTATALEGSEWVLNGRSECSRESGRGGSMCC